MKTFRLWLEPDETFPRFRRLRHELIDVGLADVLRRGIHPWQGARLDAALKTRFVEILNEDDASLEALDDFGYCSNIAALNSGWSGYGSRYVEDGADSAFEATLRFIAAQVYFVDDLGMAELVEIAREHLRRNWTNPVVYALLRNTRPTFDDMRSFLKTKDPEIKVSGYADVEALDLARILSLDDFAGEDRMLILEAIPGANFRRESVLRRLIDGEGRLRLTDRIDHFQVLARCQNGRCGARSVLYNATCTGRSVRLVPELRADPEHRSVARACAERWRLDGGAYCFTTDIDGVEQIMREGGDVHFPTLSYRGRTRPIASKGRIGEAAASVYALGPFLRAEAPAQEMRDVLRAHGVSMTGRKSDLVDKLAGLAAEEYARKAAALDAFFAQNRFVRVRHPSADRPFRFAVLVEQPLRNLLTAMYVARHLRGNAILDAAYENDACELAALARALMAGDVEITGGFLQVEEAETQAEVSLESPQGGHVPEAQAGQRPAENGTCPPPLKQTSPSAASGVTGESVTTQQEETSHAVH